MRQVARLCRVVLPLFLCLSPSSADGQNAWIKTGGPLGGLGYDVRIHPKNKNVMFVTDNWSGVNKSTNAGATWFSSNKGIDIVAGSTGDAFPIFSLSIDPNNPDRIWAGTQGVLGEYGIFRSDDGAATWTRKVNGIELEDAIGLVFRGYTIQQGNSDIVYAQAEVPTVIDGRAFNRTKGRIYKTTDAGEHWVKIWEGDNLARYLIIDPRDPYVLYASTGFFDREAYNSDCAGGIPGGVGVIKSTDGGGTWRQINNGLTDLYVGSLRMHPTNPDILFAAAGNNACTNLLPGNSPGVFRSTDGGETWARVANGATFNTVNFSPSNPGIVYAGGESAFFRSEDGGDTWNRYKKPIGWGWGPPGVLAGFPIDVVVDPADPYVLYCNNYGGGVFKSSDGAETWIPWSRGYTGANMVDIDVDPKNSALVYAAANSGPFKSENGGADWIGIANGEAQTTPGWHFIESKPDDPRVVLMSDRANGLLFRSTDGGADFVVIFRHPEAGENDSSTVQGFKAIAFSPSHPQIVYVGVSRLDLTSNPAGISIHKSMDAGLTWVGKPSILDEFNVLALAVHPTDPDIAFAGTRGGIFKTVDGGDSWAQCPDPGYCEIHSLAIDPWNPQNIYAGELFDGVWLSRDGGESWEGPIKTGFNSGNPSIQGLAIDPTNPSIVYAGDWTSGVYRSVDWGETWAPFPDSLWSGLSSRAVKDLAISSDGTVLYAATQGEGVFRYGEPPIGVEVEERPLVRIPRDFTVTQNYPNPFNPVTTVRYKIPEGYEAGVAVSLEVFNVRGQRVVTLVDAVEGPGSHEVHWDGRDESGRPVASGVYIYRMKAGPLTSTRKMAMVPWPGRRVRP